MVYIFHNSDYHVFEKAANVYGSLSDKTRHVLNAESFSFYISSIVWYGRQNIYDCKINYKNQGTGRLLTF